MAGGPHSVPQQGADHLARATVSSPSDRSFLATFLIALIAASLLIAAANLVVGGNHPVVALFHLVLPVGISFYTFNSISYTIDI